MCRLGQERNPSHRVIYPNKKIMSSNPGAPGALGLELELEAAIRARAEFLDSEDGYDCSGEYEYEPDFDSSGEYEYEPEPEELDHTHCRCESCLLEDSIHTSEMIAGYSLDSMEIWRSVGHATEVKLTLPLG